MKIGVNLKIKRLAIGAMVAVLPLAASAQGMEPYGPGRCPMPPARGSEPLILPPGLGPDIRAPFGMQLPYLRNVELTEAQQDRLFELVVAQAPAERAQAKEAAKALEALHHLAAADHFDVVKAQELATTHGQAVAKLAQMHAERYAKVRALLTPEQRKQVDEFGAKPTARRAIFKRS